ncbi:hypothetical protein POTOM_039383 [Populus tomentosa]|uniref:Uncharacterized protein n=1 Tax=Populus tomentosa TaxID=118781 RepID=A0A8X7YRL7_POPTO|nr:hypothetical protein POTOM_039383 [Populus tomentosa]
MAGARRLMSYNGAKVSRGFVSRPIPKRGQLKVAIVCLTSTSCFEDGNDFDCSCHLARAGFIELDEYMSHRRHKVEWKGLKNHVASGTVIDPVLESV